MSVTNTELKKAIESMHRDVNKSGDLLTGLDERLRATEVDMSAVKTRQDALEGAQGDIKDSQSSWNRGLLLLNVVIGAVASALGMSTRS